MIVVVSRSGGFAGIRLTWKLSVDGRPDVADWLALIAELPWEDVVATAPEPDHYVYTIHCAEQTTTLNEPQLEGPWRELVHRVQREVTPVPARARPGAAH